MGNLIKIKIGNTLSCEKGRAWGVDLSRFSRNRLNANFVLARSFENPKEFDNVLKALKKACPQHVLDAQKAAPALTASEIQEHKTFITSTIEEIQRYEQTVAEAHRARF